MFQQEAKKVFIMIRIWIIFNFESIWIFGYRNNILKKSGLGNLEKPDPFFMLDMTSIWIYDIRDTKGSGTFVSYTLYPKDST